LLIWAGLKHFGAPVDFEGDITEANIAKAYDVLRGSRSAALPRVREALRYVDALLASVEGHASVAAPEGYVRAAHLACAYLQRSEDDAAKLAQMLANVVRPGKSGKLHAGKFTRAQIVAWVTREPGDVKVATALEREERKRKGPRF